MEAMNDDEIVGVYGNGELSTFLASGIGFRGGSALLPVEDQLLRLHDAGRIDLLSVTQSDALEALDTGRFFSFVHALTRLLPHVDTDVALLLAASTSLADKGETSTSTMISNAVREWLTRRPSVARELVAGAHTADTTASTHLRLALEALSDANEARRAVSAFDDQRKDSAIAALSVIVDDPAGYEESLALLDAALGGAPEPLRARIIDAASRILLRGGDGILDRAVAVIARSAKEGGSVIRHQLAMAFLGNPALVERPEAAVWLDMLGETPPDEHGTLSLVSSILHVLADSGRGKVACALAASLVARSGAPVDASQLGSFMSALQARELATVTIEWLLSGHPALCDLLTQHFQLQLDRTTPQIVVEPETVPDDGQLQLFLARKAIGWFILTPVDAAGIVLACMRKSSGEILHTLAELLSDVLLLSYSSVRDYLESIDVPGKVGKVIRQLLARRARYDDGLRSAFEISELKPSEEQRRVQRVLASREARGVARASRELSILPKIANIMHLLHGSGAIVAQRDAGGNDQFFEMEMHSADFSMAVPGLSFFDPIGFDSMLKHFRLERRES